jgi:hypothetical protein
MSRQISWLASVTSGLISKPPQRPTPTRTETELDKYQVMRLCDVHGAHVIAQWVLNIQADQTGSRVAPSALEEGR